MKTKGFPLKKQFGGRWDKECKQWVIPMKNFPQLAKYLRTEKISIEDNTQTAFKNYNPELSFDQCEQLYCDDKHHVIRVVTVVTVQSCYYIN